MTRKPSVVKFGTNLFLVSLGHVSAVDLDDSARSSVFPASGLMLRQSLADGTAAHLFVEAPADLLGFADLQAVSLFKPVCLPLALTHVRAGRINTQLRTDDVARDLAARVLVLLTKSPHPA